MSYIINCSTNIITLKIASVLFIPVVLCELAFLPGKWIVLSPQKEYHSSSKVEICIHLAAIYKKDWKLCLPLNYYALILQDCKIIALSLVLLV